MWFSRCQWRKPLASSSGQQQIETKLEAPTFRCHVHEVTTISFSNIVTKFLAWCCWHYCNGPIAPLRFNRLNSVGINLLIIYVTSTYILAMHIKLSVLAHTIKGNQLHMSSSGGHQKLILQYYITCNWFNKVTDLPL